MATTRTAASTPSAEAVLDALRQRPGATAAELAEAAGVGRSTASKALATLEADGRASRQAGAPQGGRPAPDRWTLLPDPDQAGHGPTPASPLVADQPATAATRSQAPPDASDAEAATSATGRPGAGADQPAGTPAGGGPRLRPGALRGLVGAWLAERPGQSFGPTQIAKELGRSAGAVGNALGTMADHGQVVQTSRKPRRYAIAKRTGEQAATTR